MRQWHVRDVMTTDVITAPDNASVAAITVAVGAAGGAVSRTTVLLTPEELDQATKKKPNYTPPGQ